jgi:hypothetical protein
MICIRGRTGAKLLLKTDKADIQNIHDNDMISSGCDRIFWMSHFPFLLIHSACRAGCAAGGTRNLRFRKKLLRFAWEIPVSCVGVARQVRRTWNSAGDL